MIAADTALCPDSIAVKQQLANAIPGFGSMLDDAPQVLAGVTFYDGPPDERASLVYDSLRKAQGKETATWRFNVPRERQIWLTCSYAGTAVVLKKALAQNTRECTVVYDPKQRVAGLPLIEKIGCR